MKKCDELSNPNSCLNKAKPNDWVFVLIEKDPTMAETIRFWAAKRVEKKLNQNTDPKIVEALNLADLLDGKKDS